MRNQRKSPRRACLKRCFLKVAVEDEERVESRIINYSASGLMLELDRPLEEGTPVKIWFEADHNAAAVSGKYCLGMVRWCSRQDGNYSRMYGIGIEMGAKASAHCNIAAA